MPNRIWRDYVLPMFGVKTDKGVVTSGSQSMFGGKQITPSFRTMGEYYLRDVDIGAAINGFATTVVGDGFYFTHSNHLPIEERKDNPEAEEAIRALNAWRLRFNFYNWLYQSMIDYWGFGNIIGEYMSPGKFKKVERIPISTVERVAMTRRGKFLSLTQYIEGERVVWEKDDLASLMHMPWNPFDTGILGRGVLYTLCTSGVGYSYKTSDTNWRTEYRPPLAAVKEENDHSLMKAIHQSNPRHIIFGTGINDALGASLADQIKTSRQEDYIVVTTPQGGTSGQQAKIEVNTMTTPQSQVNPIVQRFDKQIQKGVQSPYVSLLFGDEQLSEAASRTSERLEMRVARLVRNIAGYQLMERMFNLVLIEAGYNQEQLYEMAILPTWTPLQKIEITLDGLVGLGSANFLGRDEVRSHIQYSGIELSKDPDYLGVRGGVTAEGQGSGAAGYNKAAAPGTISKGEEKAIEG